MSSASERPEEPTRSPGEAARTGRALDHGTIRFGAAVPPEPVETTVPELWAQRPPAGMTPPPTEAADGAGPRTAPPTLPPYAHNDPSGVAPQLGQTLFGHLRVDRFLGKGGMGSVWLVHHLGLDAPHALKILTAEGVGDRAARERVLREARIMARIKHPQALTVHHAWETEDAVYIEMEYVRGQSLDKVLRPGVPMPLDWTRLILHQLCGVLATAHAENIIHRDLKPSNLMVQDDQPPGRELKVLDFGLAKVLDSGDTHTRTGAIFLSAPYASPEQIRGDKDVGHRSDLYSVGIILYEFLTGHRPFSGRPETIIYKHFEVAPPPFAEVAPEAVLPPAVEQVVLRCLEKQPAARFASAQELCAAFDQALAPGRVVPPPGGTGRGRRFLLPALGLALLAAAGVAYREWGPRAGMWTDPTPGVVQVPVPTPPTPDPGKPADPPPEVVPPPPEMVPKPPPPTPPKPRASDAVRRHLAYWAGQGFTPDPPDQGTEEFPEALRHANGVRYVRASGHYLPEGFHAEGEADPADGWPQALVRDLGAGGELRLCRIAGGEFPMGSDDTPDDQARPRHPVRLSGYYLGQHEVTNALVAQYLEATGVPEGESPHLWRRRVEMLKNLSTLHKRPAEEWKSYPAVGIEYEQARRVARWSGGDLATEAQWEYAARSRDRGLVRVGDWLPKAEPPPVLDRGLVLKNTLPVGWHWRFDRTEQGVLDMAWNVRELCRDAWAEYPPKADGPPVLDPCLLPPAGNGASPNVPVVRGGAGADDRFHASTAYRRPPDPAKLDTIGFRLVVECPATLPDPK